MKFQYLETKHDRHAFASASAAAMRISLGRYTSAADVEHLLRPPVRMWIHGHTHYNADVMRNGVRVVTNQWGYPSEDMTGFRRDGLFEFPDEGES